MFLINLIPIHVLACIVTGRFSHKIYVAYTTVYCVGTILSMQISFVGFQVRKLSSKFLAILNSFFSHLYFDDSSHLPSCFVH